MATLLRTPRASRLLVTTLLAAAGLASGTSACSGDLLGELGRRGGGSGAGDEADGGRGPDGKTDPRMTYSCTPAQKASRGASLASLRRLSRDELVNTFTALLGPGIAGDEGVRTKLEGLPADKTEVAGDFVAEPPTALANVVYDVAKRGVELALADAKWKTDALGACAAAATVDDACLAESVRRFGGRAYRRDLATNEVDELVAFAKSAGGGAAGLGFALRRLLQSPSMVFHVERGVEKAEGTRVRLTPFEVASRVSFFTSGGPPDAELLAAARGGELDTLDGVRRHVDRIFASQFARDKSRDFLRYFTHLNLVPDPTPAAAKLAGVGEGKGLGEQMRAEAVAFLDDVFATGSYRDLMGSTRAFPKTPELAKVFGVALAGDGPVVAPGHPGILHRPALLASSGPRTSPIVRGAHLRKLFLCETFGMPDPAAVAAVQEQLGDLDAVSNREKTTKLTSSSACSGCHAAINPVGFAFEGFDQSGAKRSVESLFDETGKVVRTHPVDTQVGDLVLEPEGPTSLGSSADLAAAMVESWKGRACFARRAFEYYRLAAVDADADACTLSEAEQASHDGSLRDVVLAAVANDDIFWKAVP